MNLAVGLRCLVVLSILEVAAGFPKQQHPLKNGDHIESRNLDSKTKYACKIAGGKCQLASESCEGEMRQSKWHCKNEKKFGCCFKPGISYLGDNKTEDKWSANKIIMSSSAGSACRGVFVSRIETNMTQMRQIAVNVTDSIQLMGPKDGESFYSKKFEDKSSLQDFSKKIDNFGINIAAKVNIHDLFYKLKIGIDIKEKTKDSVDTGKSKTSTYISEIQVLRVPIKTANLDPFYLRLNPFVLEKLRDIENKITNKTGKTKYIFMDFFEYYGSHVMTGLIEFGGNMIIKSETNMVNSSQFENTKTLVKKSLDAYASLSVSEGFESGKGSIKVDATKLNEQLTNSSSYDMLSSITLTRETMGGPLAAKGFNDWKQGLLNQNDTWRVIGKPTKFTPIWDLIMLHHKDYFHDAENLSRLMEEDWKAITNMEMTELSSQIRNLGISPTTANERRELLVDMLSQGIVYAEKDNLTAHFDTIPGNNSLILSSLQSKKINPNSTMVQFDSIKFLPESPYKVYLRLEYNSLYLGDVIIVLDGYFTSRVNQMLQLSTGDNSANGAWRGTTLRVMYFEQFWSGMFIDTYKNAQGFHNQSLFPVEDAIETTPVVLGEVRAKPGQTVFFSISTKAFSGQTDDWLVIGHVASGLDILEAMSAHGVEAVTVSDCGLVVID